MPTPKEKAIAKDKAHAKRLAHEIDLRRAQEKNRARGEPVWFSRRILDGHLHHWALFVHNTKYELRLPPSRGILKDALPPQAADAGRLVGSVVPSLDYEVHIAPWTLKEDMLRTRDENLAEEGKPHASGDYYLCQVGWTRLSKEQVDVACQAIKESFGVYVLGFNDCQTFLRQFARRIIKEPVDCALDWPWFMTNLETKYHELQHIPADENIRAYQRQKTMVLLGVGTAVAVNGVALGYHSQEPMDPSQADGGDVEPDDGDCCDADCCSCYG